MSRKTFNLGGVGGVFAHISNFSHYIDIVFLKPSAFPNLFIRGPSKRFVPGFRLRRRRRGLTKDTAKKNYVDGKEKLCR